SLPDSGRTHEDIVRVQCGQKKTFTPVEEPALRDVHRQEAAQRAQHELAGPRSSPAPHELSGRQRRITVGPVEEVRHALVASMEEWAAEAADVALPPPRFGPVAAAEVAGAAAEQSPLPVRIESAVADPLSQEDIATRHRIAVGATVREEDLFDFVAKLR